MVYSLPGAPPETTGEEIGHEEQAAARGQRLIPGQDVKLEERVEGQELDAREGVDLFPRHALEEGFHGPVVPRVPVDDGPLEQGAVVVHQAEVHAPGVHGQAREIPARGLGRQCQPLGHAREEAVRVPSPAPLGAYRLVGKAVEGLQRESSFAERAEHGAPALGAQVEGQQGKGIHGILLGIQRPPPRAREGRDHGADRISDAGSGEQILRTVRPAW